MQTQEFYRIHSGSLIREHNRNQQFHIFIRGFKLIMVHDERELLIRHIYIDDTNMGITATPILTYINSLMNDHHQCSLAVTSDIHLQLFQLKLINSMAGDPRFSCVVINGDTFMKQYSVIDRCLGDRSSRVVATKAIANYMNAELIDDLILIRGNHDSEYGYGDLLSEKIRCRFINSFDVVIHDCSFHIRHGSYLDDMDPLDKDAYIDVSSLMPMYDKNNYLILGHSCGYVLIDELVNDYIDHERQTLYIDDSRSFRRTRNRRKSDYPVYCHPYRKGSSKFNMYESGRDSLEFCAYDLIFECECRRINLHKEKSTALTHLLCLNNIRFTTPLFPNKLTIDFPKFVSFQ